MSTNVPPNHTARANHVSIYYDIQLLLMSILCHISPFLVTLWWLNASSGSSPSHDRAPNSLRFIFSLDCFGL